MASPGPSTAPWPLPEPAQEDFTTQAAREPTVIPNDVKTPRSWSIWNHKRARSTESPTTDTSLPNLARPVTSASAKEQRRTKRENEEKGRQERQEIAKQKAEKYKEEKKVRRDEERARKKFIGGVQWGFDATAGTRQPAGPKNSDAGYYVSMGHLPQRPDASCEVDDIGRLTGRRWTEKTTFGIEYGGPGKEGKYGHGSLRHPE